MDDATGDKWSPRYSSGRFLYRGAFHARHLLDFSFFTLSTRWGNQRENGDVESSVAYFERTRHHIVMNRPWMAHDSEMAIRARVKLNISIFENNQCRSVVRGRHDISWNVERRQLQSRVCQLNYAYCVYSCHSF